MIIIITLIIVALTDNLITNLENDFCWLKAMRRAINPEIVNRHDFRFQK
jgi:hypothetical protein